MAHEAGIGHRLAQVIGADVVAAGEQQAVGIVRHHSGARVPKQDVGILGKDLREERRRVLVDPGGDILHEEP